jgi:hypothetical protein
MRTRKLALIAFVFVSSLANAAEVACDREGLLAMLYDAPTLNERPQLSGSQPGRLIYSCFTRHHWSVMGSDTTVLWTSSQSVHGFMNRVGLRPNGSGTGYWS